MRVETYKDPDTLKRLYHHEELTVREMADRLDCGYGTIRRWMERFGIERRDREQYLEDNQEVNYANLSHKPGGYEIWVAWDPKKQSNEAVSVHRLAAVAWFGWEAVIDNDVHHKNNVQWDNREDNFELMGHAEHTAHHKRGECHG